MSDTDTYNDQSGLLNPVGYRLLLRPIPITATTRGGLLMPDQTILAKQYLRQIGQVVAMGDAAYTHPKFSGRPWCKVGDNVLFNSYSGVQVEGRASKDDEKMTTFKFINDDEVLAVTERPSDIQIYCD